MINPRSTASQPISQAYPFKASESNSRASYDVITLFLCLITLLIPAIDIMTTYLGLQSGLQELNPFARQILSLGGYTLLVIVDYIVVGGLVYMVLRLRKNLATALLLVPYSISGCLAIANNVSLVV